MHSLQAQLSGAIWRGDATQVKALLTAGASPNESDSKGWTPLMQAIEIGNVEIIQLLIAAGGEINKKGRNGCTCLHIAIDASIDGSIQNGGVPRDEHTEIIQLLLTSGADIHIQNDEGQTPLDWARNYGSQKIIRFLELKD